MARPKKEEHERRSVNVKTDLTIAEKLYVQQQVKNSGLRSESEYFRMRVLGYHVPPAPQKVDAAVISELNRIGVNLNQLARAANSDRRLESLNPAELLEEVSTVLAKVASFYDH